MKLFSAVIVFGTAFALSMLAGSISIVGMMALFQADGIIIALMMGVLEVSKLVTAGWLHANWRNRSVSVLHKSYLALAVIALMVITAIGIYGYLAKGYLDQQVPMGAVSLQIAQKERQIETEQGNVQRLNDRQAQLDASVNSLVSQKLVIRSLSVRAQQKRERDQVAAELLTAQKDIDRLSAELVPMRMQNQNVEGKLGPIKFVADLFGWTKPDVAVRMVILILMFAFDPLAVVLVLSGAISVRDHFKRPPRITESQFSRVKIEPEVEVKIPPLDDVSDKQELLRILQRNPDSIEDILDTVIEWHDRRGDLGERSPTK